MIVLNKILVAIIPLILSIIVSMAPLKVLAEDSNYSSEYSKNLKLNNNTAIFNNNTTAGLHSNTSKPLLKVVASFFPIYEFVKAVGGDRVQTSVLIPIGSEPHDFDPTIQEISNAQSADMVVYNGAGMESVWINKINPKFAVDTSQGLNLLSSSDKEASTGVDPHIWLDPVLAEHQVNMIRDGLIKVDPGNANYYKTNAQKFIDTTYFIRLYN